MARGKIKIEGKAKFAQISANVMNDMFFGATSTTGTTMAIFQEAHSVPASVSYVFTATNVTGFKDLGCRYAATGIALTLVASGPTVGQYAVSTVGVYTFAAADASAAMLHDYTYTTVSGLNLAISNQLMGAGPRFKTVCTQTYTTNGISQTWVMTLAGEGKLNILHCTEAAGRRIRNVGAGRVHQAGAETINSHGIVSFRSMDGCGAIGAADRKAGLGDQRRHAVG